MTTSGGTLVVVPHASPGQLQASPASSPSAWPDGRDAVGEGWQRSRNSGQGPTSACRLETARPARSPRRSARSARRPPPPADPPDPDDDWRHDVPFWLLEQAAMNGKTGGNRTPGARQRWLSWQPSPCSTAACGGSPSSSGGSASAGLRPAGRILPTRIACKPTACRASPTPARREAPASASTGNRPPAAPRRGLMTPASSCCLPAARERAAPQRRPRPPGWRRGG